MSLTLLVAACSAVRPVTPTPTPASVREYLSSHPHAVLRIADSTGRKQWIYEANLHRDTLLGLRYPTMPREPIAMPLHQVTEIAAHRFSAKRTLGVLAGVAALGGWFALMVGRHADF